MGYIQDSGHPQIVVNTVTGRVVSTSGLPVGTYPYVVRATENRGGVTVYGQPLALTHEVTASP